MHMLVEPFDRLSDFHFSLVYLMIGLLIASAWAVDNDSIDSHEREREIRLRLAEINRQLYNESIPGGNYQLPAMQELHKEKRALEKELDDLVEERRRERVRLRGGTDIPTERTKFMRRDDSSRKQEKEARVRAARRALGRKAAIRKFLRIGGVLAIIVVLMLAANATISDKGRKKKHEDLPHHK
jgi:hypothetical protein